MAKVLLDGDGCVERIFRDPVVVNLELKIDVTDEPDELTELTAAFLRRLVSEHEGTAALARDELAAAVASHCDVVRGCVSCDADVYDALDNLAELCAVDLEADEDTRIVACGEQERLEYLKRKHGETPPPCAVCGKRDLNWDYYGGPSRMVCGPCWERE